MKNLKFTFTVILILMATQLLSANSVSGIAYQYTTWDKVLEQAKEDQLPIFVKTFASYCMPCKMMDKNVYPDPEVSSVFNQNFINFKVDMQSKIGNIFNLAYDVNAVPDLLFFNPEGDIILRATGGKSKSEILQLASQALVLMTEPVINDEILFVSTEEIVPHKIDIKNTITQQPIINKTITRATTDFSTAQLPPVQQINSETQVLLSASSDPYSDAIFGMLKNKSKLRKELGKVEVDRHFRESINGIVFQGIADNSTVLLEKALTVLKKSDLEEKTSMKLNLSLNFFSETGDWMSFSKTVKKQMINKKSNISNILSATKQIAAESNDLNAIKMAAKWMKKLAKKSPGFEVNMTYSKVLIQLKQYDKALMMAKLANDIAQAEERSSEESQILMREIEYIR